MQKGDMVGLVTVIVILIGIGAFFAYAPKAAQVVYAPVEIPGSLVTVSEETGGQTVYVTAEVKRPGYVTVHEAVGEAPGPIIGVSPLLAPGSYPDLPVEVTGTLSPLSDYFVLLFVDDGDGAYEPGIDLPVMTEGKVIKQPITL